MNVLSTQNSGWHIVCFQIQLWSLGSHFLDYIAEFVSNE